VISSCPLHIVTCEYPPDVGGVSDYTRNVATALAAEGMDVHVWCPSSQRHSLAASGDESNSHGSAVTVHRALGKITPLDLKRVDKELNAFEGPRHLLVQWVPHGYGYKSLNVLFCLWLWSRWAWHRDHVDVIVHEPFLEFGVSSKQNVAAAVQRIMIKMLLKAARQVWITIPAWENLLRPYASCKNLQCRWLPVPSNIPVVDNPRRISETRKRLIKEEQVLIGHFGTFGGSVSEMLTGIVRALLEETPEVCFLLMGRDSDTFREHFSERYAKLAHRVQATGMLNAGDLSAHISSCDVMIQPYPDGISTRRTSAMVSLVHGKPVVTTTGPLTEDFWAKSGAVAMTEPYRPDEFVRVVKTLLADRKRRLELSETGRKLYEEKFDIKQTVAALQAAWATPVQA